MDQAASVDSSHPQTRLSSGSGAMSIVVKFPYSVSRRASARMPRRSKNGTPEERATKEAKAAVAVLPPATVTQLPRPRN
jgi:hypothetical protein